MVWLVLVAVRRSEIAAVHVAPIQSGWECSDGGFQVGKLAEDDRMIASAAGAQTTEDGITECTGDRSEEEKELHIR
jgi:hypothetical protein